VFLNFWVYFVYSVVIFEFLDGVGKAVPTYAPKPRCRQCGSEDLESWFVRSLDVQQYHRCLVTRCRVCEFRFESDILR